MLDSETYQYQVQVMDGDTGKMFSGINQRNLKTAKVTIDEIHFSVYFSV